MKKTVLVALLIFTSIQIFAHVEKLYNLRGTFGDREVVVEIMNVDNQYYSARYCFLDKKRSVYMNAEYDSVRFKLVSAKYNPETKSKTVIEFAEIREDSSYNWSGHWKSPEGRLYEVSLWPFAKDSSEQHAIKGEKLKNELSVYSYTRLKDIKYNKIEKETLASGITVEWLVEPLTGTKGFRIVSGLPDTISRKLNLYLEREQIKSIEASLNCGMVDFQGTFESELTISYFTPKVLSIVHTTQSNCYNTTGKQSIKPHTIDVETLEELHIENFLWFGDSADIPRNGSKEYFDYRRNLFGNAIAEYMGEHYRKKAAKHACDFSDERIYQTPLYYLTSKGMVLILNYYNLEPQCKQLDWAVLKYSDFKGKWKSKYLDLKK